jgi:hypothetical protein
MKLVQYPSTVMPPQLYVVTATLINMPTIGTLIFDLFLFFYLFIPFAISIGFFIGRRVICVRIAFDYPSAVYVAYHPVCIYYYDVHLSVSPLHGTYSVLNASVFFHCFPASSPVVHHRTPNSLPFAVNYVRAMQSRSYYIVVYDV